MNTGWLVVSTPLKNMKVSWDDDIPNIWKVIKMFQTTNHLGSGGTDPHMRTILGAAGQECIGYNYGNNM